MASTTNNAALPGNKLWLGWLAANLIAFVLSHVLLGLVDLLVDLVGAHGLTFVGIAGHLGALGLGGAIVGLAQARFIQSYLTRSAQWGLSTWVAYVLAFFSGETFGGLPLGLLLSFTLFGAVSGPVQSRLLSQQGFPSARWALGSCLGFAAGGVAASGLLLAAFAIAGRAILDAVPVPVALGVMGGVGAGVGAAITGLILAVVLRHRSSTM